MRFSRLFSSKLSLFITGFLGLPSSDKNRFPWDIYYSYFPRLNIVLFFHRLSDHYLIESRLNLENIGVLLAQKRRFFGNMRNKAGRNRLAFFSPMFWSELRLFVGVIFLEIAIFI